VSIDKSAVKKEIVRRVHEQIALEVSGNVAALYEFTLPEIREERIVKRNDEPSLSLAGIEEFVSGVTDAEVISVDIEKFHERAPLYSNKPAVLVVSKVKYNGHDKINQSRTIWVLDNGTWYTTALGKISIKRNLNR